MNLYLQNIVDSIQLETLPAEWQQVNFVKFSANKNLYDYQQQALKNALKALYKYYVDSKADKDRFFNLYKNNGFTENRDYKLNGSRKFKIFKDYEKDYTIKNNEIAFHHFINRMSFWMATGSGKTLVIVKLLELLGYLIQNQQIPNNDILFLTYREDLIEQFRNHVKEFNHSNNDIHINLKNLKDYEEVKKENRLKFDNEIDVYYYRSDLMSDEHKEKIVDFRNYDNNGNWYIILDEAHKGDKEESKRQHYYAILSRNGFLFNFSATFTDPVDFATCVFNFNLQKFITQGYGKHILLSQSNVATLTNANEFTEEHKQVIIVKILLLHTLITKLKPENYYHKPLLLTLVNSVNTEDSDLELFFREIEKVAREGVSNNLLQEAKKELKNDLNHQCEFDDEKIEIKEIDNIEEKDILRYVFNAETKGNIEVLKIPGNKQEIVFKLATSEKPFGLIKIGDISEWIKNKLPNYQIIEKFENESIFRNINQDDSDITILMGSRAFYEGWDSNRPNIILYINIGKGADAKKFVLQSLGRGVRIEPLPHKRKRIQFLYNNNEIDENVFETLKDSIKPLETLFVYGTKAENLKEVIETLNQEQQEELIGDLFEINPDTKDKLLLIPVYADSDKILADESSCLKFEISQSDLNLTKNYIDYIGDKVAVVKYDMQPKILQKIKESFLRENDFYKTDSNIAIIQKPEIIVKNLIRHFSIRTKEFKEFKKLENEIIHFKQIRITKDTVKEIRTIIETVKKFPDKKDKENELDKKHDDGEITREQYKEQLREIDNQYKKEILKDELRIKYLDKHYYIPVVLSTDERINYIKHIIKTRSEVEFINQLEEYLKINDNWFTQFDWWYFSKIDETLDEVYIPYYQPKTNKIEKFKPDFIFWLKKGNEYTILFVDPKGTEHADGYRKIDGYSRIFEEEKNGRKQSRNFPYEVAISNEELTITIKLLLKTNQIESVLDNYKQYWFIKLEELPQKIC
ncbi:MAG: DEAD/DEAH box helicase family protein [Leptonema sp. (in: bacteria)]